MLLELNTNMSGVILFRISNWEYPLVTMLVRQGEDSQSIKQHTIHVLCLGVNLLCSLLANPSPGNQPPHRQYSPYQAKKAAHFSSAALHRY